MAIEAAKPASKRLVETVVQAKMVGVGQLLRGLFDQRITDPAELRRRAREYLMLPSRIAKREKTPESEDVLNRVLTAALLAARIPR